METAQEFMERYLKEAAGTQKAVFSNYISLFKSFHTAECLERFLKTQSDRENNLEKLEMVEEHNGSVKAFTTEQFETLNFRRRYHLLLQDTIWKITRTDYACSLCAGTGKKRDSTECSFCKGTGWKRQG